MSGNARRSRPPRSAPGSSWEHVAGWYDGWVGQHGSVYHRALAVPTVLDLLDARPGESILDVGCGQGVLAPHLVRAGARYIGVDASPRLVDAARRRHGRFGRFVVADARDLAASRNLRPHDHHAAVFLLSIQDIDDLDAVFDSVDWALRRSSRVVILMTHPAFRQPRHSGWGYDEGRKLAYRRIDAYLTPMAVPMKAIGAGHPTRSFHRPLETYVNGLAELGFAVDAMRELPDLSDADRPRGRRPATRADAEIPLFLAIRARRP